MARDLYPTRVGFIRQFAQITGHALGTARASLLESRVPRDAAYHIVMEDLAAGLAAATVAQRERIASMDPALVLTQPLGFWVTPERLRADEHERRRAEATRRAAQGRDSDIADTHYMCRNCGSRKVLTNTRQTRSGDEGARTLRWCDECGSERICFSPISEST